MKGKEGKGEGATSTTLLKGGRKEEEETETLTRKRS